MNPAPEKNSIEAQRQQERYRTLLHSMDEGFCTIEVIFDENGKPVDYRFLEINEAFERHTGLRDVQGKRVREFVPDHDQHWFETYGRVALTGEPARLEDHARALGRWYAVYAFRLGPPEHPEVAVFFSDITARKQAEEALRLSQQALEEQAETLRRADRSKDEFLAMLAHELRNPIAPLSNAAELLQTADASPEERAQASSIMTRQIKHMGRLLDDLLDVSRINEGKIELRKKPVALGPILSSVESLARSLCAANGQKLTVTLPPEPLYLDADATRLEQVFGNLLGNACKYSGEGCQITVSAERDAAIQPPEVVVRVQDNGAGIDPELLPRVFDLFVQASRSLDRAHGGLGIGLTLVRRLVELHGGRIEAHSKGLGQGSEFAVHLPILANVAPASSPQRRLAGGVSRRILIVDDNMDSARSMATLQVRRGHEVRTAATGPEGLAAAAAFLPEVVLLDIGLPGMDGFEVARRLRARPALSKAFLIAMTGYASSEDRRAASEAGFDEHLVKPVDLDILHEWLNDPARFPPQ